MSAAADIGEPPPDRAAGRAGSQLAAFIGYCEQRTGLAFADHDAFYRFSVEHYRAFWSLFLAWSGIRYTGSPDPVCRGDEIETAEFFPHLRLNYVENLLDGRPELDDQVAIIARHARGATVRLSRRHLREQVQAIALAYQRRGLRAGDRVVAISDNTEHLVLAALGALAVGATLSTASPDMGPDGIVARFGQLAPVLLLLGSADAALGTVDSAPSAPVDRILTAIPSLRTVVLLDEQLDDRFAGDRPGVDVLHLADLLAGADEFPPDGSFSWPRLPFNHPLVILFSSGTTGPPKCIVHSAGGVLLEHRKEHVLHEDLRPADTLFFHTSPAWMMWNWQLSALGTGCAIVLYDGRVSEPDALWSIVAGEQVTAFGTGPSYLQFCRRHGFSPRETLPLSRLRVLLSTGAVLRDEQFDWVAEHVGPVPVHSISGGTDIVGCFVLGHPELPVRRGECQCRSLGLDVRALHRNAAGVGELICANPFPSRPLGLYGDTDGSTFHAAYFAANEGVWTHGDLIEITGRGSARMHGRSDSMLNIGGTRIGPAEIYAIVNARPEVARSMAVEQRRSGAAEQSRLVLLVVAAEPGRLDAAAQARLRQALARGATAAHVPGLIVEVAELPVTYSNKDSEVAVSDALSGRPIRNLDALQNPHVLDDIVAAVRRADEELEAGGRAPLPADLVSGICAIFARELGIAAVQPQDSFFDLGGTSLLLASVRQSIYERLGHDIALSAIAAAPRPAALARFLGEPNGGPASALVPLRGGSAEARPIFVVHDVTGDVLAYRALAESLTTTRPVLGVRSRGYTASGHPDRTVAQMAATALASVRSAQPHGPYALVGYSFGGMVAFEMARQLRSAGEPVDPLVLVDCYVDPRCYGRLRGWAFLAVGRPFGYLRMARQARPADVLRVIGRVGRRLARRLVPTRIAAAALLDRSSTPRANAIEARADLAFRRYRPAPLAGDVVFVRAAERELFRCRPLPIWRRATGGDLVVVDTPGDHHTALARPHVSELAGRLDRLLT